VGAGITGGLPPVVEETHGQTCPPMEGAGCCGTLDVMYRILPWGEIHCRVPRVTMKKMMNDECRMMNGDRRETESGDRDREGREKREKRLGTRHPNLLTDRSSCSFLNFPMSWYGNRSTVLGVAIDGMASAFSIEITAVLLQVTN